ncbi:transcriptional regulator [Acidianus sp. RZ1]|uniref:transcriptional regulator n=1 Tax=Acidianus sp. RZ1 TaxID=1540082 RepID=UPI0020A356B9|nr:transcriptional regulator [Acidianus sp. RZ1]
MIFICIREKSAMKWKTNCEEAYEKIVPYLRTAIVKKLAEEGLSIRSATSLVGVSITSYEKHVNDERVEKILKDEELNDMVTSLSSRLRTGDRVESVTFCLLCSKSRKIFGLEPCLDL